MAPGMTPLERTRVGVDIIEDFLARDRSVPARMEIYALVRTLTDGNVDRDTVLSVLEMVLLATEALTDHLYDRGTDVGIEMVLLRTSILTAGEMQGE